MKRMQWAFWIFAAVALSLRMSSAADALPYLTRTHTYDGMRTSVQGDLRTVGLAGGSVGLGNTYLTTLYNPAGLAMSLNGADANIAQNSVYDGAIQNIAHGLTPYSLGLAFAPYPWGFGFFYRSTPLEGQSYSLPGLVADPATFKVSTSDYSFAMSRVFFKDRLSLGAGIVFGQAQESIETTSISTFATGNNIAATFGASWQFPRRWILGIGFSTPVRYSVASNGSTPLVGFFQPIEVPSRLGVGLGWMPNRFFRTDFSMYLVGATQSAALLKDDSVRIGQVPTLQPKVGLGYQFIDFKELRVTLNVGTYLEISRIENFPNRLHLTSSLEVSPWILFFGFGVDTSHQYGNYIFSLGLNVIKTMEKLEMIPPLSLASHRGWTPDPMAYNDNGLSRALVKGPLLGPVLDPLQIGLDIPSRFGQKVEDIGNGIVSVEEGISSGISSALNSAFGKSKPNRKFKEKPSLKRNPRAGSVL